MKDSCIGVYGVLGLVLIFLLKISVLGSMLTPAVPIIVPVLVINGYVGRYFHRYIGGYK